MAETTASSRVGNLKKITLAIAAGRSPSEVDTTSRPHSMTFIYGLGTAGLTPFECALADKATGDEVAVVVRTGELTRTFGHLPPPFNTAGRDTDDLHLRVRIEKIEPAEGREIISAMAAAAECGCTCGCGGRHGAC